MEPTRKSPCPERAAGVEKPATARGRPLPARPRWGRRLIACVLVAVLIAAALAWWQDREKSARLRDTALARRAKKSAPQIAALMLELNDRVCDLVEKYPYSPDALHVLGQLHFVFGESDEALRYWERCLELAPDFVPASRSIGVMYLDTGKHKLAVKYLRKAVQQDPTSPMLSVELAQSLVAIGQYDEAIDILNKDLKRHPRAVATLAMLGHAYLEQRNYQKAREYFEKTIKVGPDYTNAYFGLVTACNNLGDREAAEKYNALLKKYKKRDEQSHRKVLKTFNDLERTKESASNIYTMIGNVYLAHSDPTSAEKAFLRAVELCPESSRPYEVLAWLYVQQGRTEEARQMLEKLSQAAPKDLACALTGGTLYMQLGLYQEAEQCFKHAIELTPQQAGGYVALARLYLRAGIKPKETLQLAQKAVQLEPLAKFYFLLGNAYQANGRITEARKAVAKAVSLDPTNTEYRRILDLFGPIE